MPKRCATIKGHSRTKKLKKDEPTIENLPNEILLNIFEFIPPWYLVKSVIRVCRLWNVLARKAVRYLPSKIIEAIHPLDAEKLQKLTTFPNLEHLSIGCCSIELSSKALPIVANFKGLSIQLSKSISARSIESLIELKKLKRLDLGGCHTVSTRAFSFLSRMTSLECLGLYDGFGSSLDILLSAATLPNLRSLVLENFWMKQKGFPQILTLKKLTHLTLDCCHLLNDNVLRDISRMPNLHAARISAGLYCMQVALKWFTESESLKLLIIDGLKIDEECLAVIHKNSQLKLLYFSAPLFV